ncbi:MAG: MG2 domain-containing protein [Candidatus Gracilibacteria bacterium]|jgi:uncharacterized protein YfaS (alpha-2-macroglobulin family)|nr:MG2 domain-containing protein [Candidatus Gracilibacteria bacterium]
MKKGKKNFLGFFSKNNGGKKVLIGLLSAFFIILLSVGSGFFYWKLSPIPEVIGVNETNIEKNISFNAPFRVRFSAKMDKESTENAFNIEPKMAGDFVWENENTVLVFRPKNKLEIGNKYTITIDTGAKNTFKKNIKNRFSETFFVIGSPEVIFLTPVSVSDWAKIKGEKKPDDSEPAMIQKGQQITVSFSRPMRSVGDNNFDFSKYFTTKPEIKGEFRWLGTSAFEFYPDSDSLPMGDYFEVFLKEGFPSSDGGMTDRSYSWSIETEEPKIISTEPSNYEREVDPKGSFEIHWNQDVDIDSLFNHIDVTPDLPADIQREIIISPKDANTENENPKISVISFKPSFAQGEEVKVTVKKGVKNLKGKKESKEDYEFTFFTLNEAKILSYFPEDNHKVSPNKALRLNTTTRIDAEKILDAVYFVPEIKKEDISISGPYYDYDNKKGYYYHVYIDGLRANASYTWGLKKGLIDEYEQEMAEGFESKFTTGNYDSRFYLMSNTSLSGVHDKDQGASLFVKSINTDSLNIKFCKISLRKYAELELNHKWYDSFFCPEGNLVEWTEAVDSETNKWKITEIPISGKYGIKDGIWIYEVNKEIRKNWSDYGLRAMLLSNATLTIKEDDQKYLVYATGFENAEPIADMIIKIIDDAGNEQIVGKTNTDGFLEIKKTDEYQNHFFIGQKANQEAYASPYWLDGISSWDFDIDRDWRRYGHKRAYVFTDRPIYRPGDEVNFKGIVRQDFDADLKIPEDRKIKAEISTPRNKMVFEKELKITDMGTFYDQFTLSESAELGAYHMSFKVLNDKSEEGKPDYNDWFSESFWVEEYKKPNFKIDITSEKDYVVDGQEFEAEIDVARYFGAKMKDTEVNWYVIEEGYYFDKLEGEHYSFSDGDGCYFWCYSRDQEHIKSGSGKTDKNGKLKVKFPLELTKKSPRLITLRVNVHNRSAGESVSAAKTFEAYPSDKLVGIRTKDYFLDKNATKANVSVIVIDPEANPIKNQSTLVNLYEVNWNSIRKKGVDGDYHWEYEEELKELDKKTIETAYDGKAEFSFDMKPSYKGELRVVATLGDMKSAYSFYKSSNEYIAWAKNNNPRMDIIPNKTSYDIGEKAKLIVKIPFEGKVNSLVTIERKNIISYETKKLKSGDVLEVEITEDMMPNIYVSVFALKGKGIQDKLNKKLEELNSKKEIIASYKKDLEEKAVKKSENENELKKLGLDKDNKEENKAKIALVHQENKAIESEENKIKIELSSLESERLNLETEIQKMVPDMAIEDLKISNTDPSPEFKMGLVNLPVNTKDRKLDLQIATNQERYMPGEKVEIVVKASDFAKNELENVDLAIAVVDESVLALKSRNMSDIIQEFWGERGVGVGTFTSLINLVERINIEAQKGEKGGGGGANDAESLATKKRGEFKDTAYFLASGMTDANGVFKTNFELPDNLTTWQILVVASNNDSQFGLETKNFITKKQLSIVPALPRFAIQGDEFLAGATVVNQSGESTLVELSLKAENFKIDSNASRKFALQDGEEAYYEFKGKVDSKNIDYNQFEDMKFTFRVESAMHLDETEYKVPVKAPSILENDATSGFVDDTMTEFFRFPANAIDGIGKFSLVLTNLKTGDLNEPLGKLLDYPYDCIEQNTSKILANVAAKKVVDKMQLKEKDLEKNINLLLQKIYQYQIYDGGFSYWTKDRNAKSSFYFSSYVLYGLNNAIEAGAKVDQDVLKRLENYLLISINDDENSDQSRVFALMALSYNKDLKDQLLAHVANFSEKIKDMNNFSKVALLRSGQNLELKHDNLLKYIEGLVFIDARGAHLQSEKGYFNSDVKNTALLLSALLKEDKDHLMIPKMIEFMQTAKTRSVYTDMPWGNTQNAAFAFMSYSDYLATVNIDGYTTIEAMLNSELFAEKTWDKNTIKAAELFTKNSSELRKTPMENELNLKNLGSERVFYDLTVNYFVKAEDVVEKSNGLTVVRELYALDDEDMKNPVYSAKKGEVLKGKVVVMSPVARDFVVVDMPIPAGFELINLSLETEDQSLVDEMDNGNDRWYWWANRWFDHKEFRDDRLLLFSNHLTKGKHEYQFLIRATNSGKYQFLPTKVEEMYHAETFGRTQGGYFEVK